MASSAAVSARKERHDMGMLAPGEIKALRGRLANVSIRFARHRRARNYVLRVVADKTVHVTIPSRGSRRIALSVVLRHVDWIEEQFRKRAETNGGVARWIDRSWMLFRGEWLQLRVDPERGRIRIGEIGIDWEAEEETVQSAVEGYLWDLARQELPRRVEELAERHALVVKRVSVRNQKSRWGSCSSKGTVSLNWRLVQTPREVRDYIILHELMHLKEMNHSDRFWRLVSEAAPRYRRAEQWLKEHRYALLG